MFAGWKAIIKASDDVAQMLDDHIVMTQTMTFSPYKKPFEERISSWETKLRITQVSDGDCVSMVRFHSNFDMQNEDFRKGNFTTKFMETFKIK